MWRPKEEPEDVPKLQITHCPVCKVCLGRRDVNTIFMAHCEECRATFYWRPKETIPSAMLDKDKPKKCGCNGCGR